MDRLMKELSGLYGLHARGTQAWGTIDGYWFRAQFPPNSLQPLRFLTAVRFSDEAAAHRADLALAGLTRQVPSASFNRDGTLLRLNWKMPFFRRSLKAEDVSSLLSKMTALLRGAGAAPVCGHCGAGEPSDFALAGGLAVKLCEGCLADLEASAGKEPDEITTAENGIWKGALGALLGAFTGSLAWVAVGLLGYMAAIGGVAIPLCAAKGYSLMKGKPGKAAVCAVGIASILAMAIAIFATLDFVILQKGAQMSFWAVLEKLLSMLFVNKALTEEVIREAIFGLAFLVLGGYLAIKLRIVKQTAVQEKFEKL